MLVTHRHTRTWNAFYLALGALSACSADAPSPIDGVQGAAYAVLSSDYTVSSIGLLGADGALLEREFVHSGSARAGLVTALSGDVALPTRSGQPGVLTLIDRYRSDVITRIDIASGRVLGQVKTQEATSLDDERSFSSNPYDYAQIDPTTAWVSRYGVNPSAERSDVDQGIDLLRIDPKRMQRTRERIDLSAFNAEAERTSADTGETERVTVYARPGRIVRLGESLVVGLESLSQTFDAAGEGMVALVDLDTRRVETLVLPGLQSCGEVVPVPDDDSRVAVACSGVYFGDDDAPSTAGLAMLELRDGELAIEHIWRAVDDPDAAVTRYALIAIDGRTVIAVAAGDAELSRDGEVVRPMTEDTLYRVDLARGEQHELFEAEGRYVLGGGVFDARGEFLLVPDASTDADGKPTAGVRRFERGADGEFEPVALIELDDVLPPREIKPLD